MERSLLHGLDFVSLLNLWSYTCLLDQVFAENVRYQPLYKRYLRNFFEIQQYLNFPSFSHVHKLWCLWLKLIKPIKPFNMNNDKGILLAFVVWFCFVLVISVIHPVSRIFSVSDFKQKSPKKHPSLGYFLDKSWLKTSQTTFIRRGQEGTITLSW